MMFGFGRVGSPSRPVHGLYSALPGRLGDPPLPITFHRSFRADGLLLVPRVSLRSTLSGGRRTHSLRIDLDMLVVTASPARTALEISQLADGGMPPTYDSMH
jgi:hypothetical protein